MDRVLFVILAAKRVLQLYATPALMGHFLLMVCVPAIKDTISPQELVISVVLTA